MTRIVENGRHVGPRPQGTPATAAEHRVGPGEDHGPGLGAEIRVNGRPIGREEIAAEAQHHPAETPRAALKEAAEALVVRELLLQEAARLDIAAAPQSLGPGLTETPQEATIRQLMDTEIAVPTADEATCRRYYDNNRRKFGSSTLYEARHILLPARPEDETARKAAAERAAGLLAILHDAPERFAALATAHSACPSKDSGGNLGQLSQGQTVPEFEAVLIRMDQGKIWPEPVSTPYGLHIIALERRIEGRQLPFEAVKDDIAAYLHEASWRRAVRQYLQLLAGRADLAGISLDAASSPLVQ